MAEIICLEVYAMEKNIYIKVDQSSRVSKEQVLVGDVAEVYCYNKDIALKIEQLPLTVIPKVDNGKFVLSVLKIVQVIQQEFPGYTTNLCGEPEFVIEYLKDKKQGQVLLYGKVILLSIIVFVGAAFTIMTFNTDVSVGEVFNQLYYLVQGEEKQGGSILELAYSIGIPVGILGFYNHFATRKSKKDPTPIHIEMRNYEEEMNKAIISDALGKGEERN